MELMCVRCSEIDLSRHISCEPCGPEVTGGYDPELNQIIVCQNRTGKMLMNGVLAHEMLHMFDYCRAKFDFNNIEHIACSEVLMISLISFLNYLIDLFC